MATHNPKRSRYNRNTWTAPSIDVSIEPMVDVEAMRSAIRQAVTEVMGIEKEKLGISPMEIEKVKTLNLPYGNLNSRKLRIRR